MPFASGSVALSFAADAAAFQELNGIGNIACAAVLEYRHHDKSNQVGDLAQGPYSDWTGYALINTPSPIPARAAPSDPNHWHAAHLR